MKNLTNLTLEELWKEYRIHGHDSIGDEGFTSGEEVVAEEINRRMKFFRQGLGDLLAIIHGDGGHYQAEHGDEKAIEDAKKKYYSLREQVEAARRSLSEMIIELGRVKELVGHEDAEIIQSYIERARDAAKEKGK